MKVILIILLFFLLLFIYCSMKVASIADETIENIENH
jgi:hypothetical protein